MTTALALAQPQQPQPPAVMASSVLKRWLQTRPGGFEAAVARAYDPPYRPVRLLDSPHNSPRAARRLAAHLQTPLLGGHHGGR